MPISFNTYKANTVQKLYNRRLINKSDMQEIIQARNLYGFANRISDCFEEKMGLTSGVENDIYKRGFVLSKEIPLVRAIQSKLETGAVKFAKILSHKDTNPEVLKVKKEIKKEFGIKSLYLDNNLSYAKRIQKALRILQENEIPLADEIVVNSILNFSMGISSPETKKIMILNAGMKNDFYTSTESPLHTIVHEGIHIDQPDNVKVKFKKMPKQFKETIDNLSIYASGNFILEVHAELMAKKLLTPKEFTSKEQEALNYIENIFKQYS